MISWVLIGNRGLFIFTLFLTNEYVEAEDDYLHNNFPASLLQEASQLALNGMYDRSRVLRHDSSDIGLDFCINRTQINTSNQYNAKPEWIGWCELRHTTLRLEDRQPEPIGADISLGKAPTTQIKKGSLFKLMASIIAMPVQRWMQADTKLNPVSLPYLEVKSSARRFISIGQTMTLDLFF